MDAVLHYLELKNQYYEKFYAVSVKFLDQANLDKWEDLEFFVDNRDRILNIIRSFDFKIAKAFEQSNPASQDSEYYRKRVKELLDRRAAIAHKVVSVDLELISKIDEFKNNTINELKDTVKTKQGIDCFERPDRPRERKPVKDV